MHIIPMAAAALQKLRSAARHPAPATKSPEEQITGVSFIEQEPDLAKEAGAGTLEISGWAASGHPSAE